MHILFIVATNNSEHGWDAFNAATFFINQGEQVTVFLISEGVELEWLNDDIFDVPGKIREFIEIGGALHACKICLDRRNIDLPRFAGAATLAVLHQMVKECDRVISF